MKKALNLIGYVVLFVVIYLGINFWRSPTAPAHITLSYIDTHGSTTDVATLSHERPVLVYFWGSWCGICQLTSPNVQALHAQNHPVISVAVSSGDDDELLGYLNQHNYHFTTINDSDGVLFRAWGGQVTPSFVIVRDGKVHQSFTGVSPLWLLRLRLWLAQ
ncbi:MAG: protein disulfide oxidoreductase [Moraxella sp.]|nr:protein disulfide oxidoreductase [Moraxella sp.]